VIPLIAFSVSNSPDLDRLGLFERSLKLTVCALATSLVRNGARVAYGGNLDRSGFTYALYPAVAEAYRSLASQTGRPPFVHFVARYQNGKNHQQS
jgi:SLOG cluster2